MEKENSCSLTNKKIVLFLIMVLCFSAIIVISILRERIVDPAQYNFSVSAEGKVFAKPDIALLTSSNKS